MSDVIQTHSAATIEIEAFEEDGITALDLSSIIPDANNLWIVMNGPKGTVKFFTGATAPPTELSTDGVDGKFRVTLLPTDVVIEGPWQYQGFAKLGANDEFWSPKLNFEAEDNLPIA